LSEGAPGDSDELDMLRSDMENAITGWSLSVLA